MAKIEIEEFELKKLEDKLMKYIEYCNKLENKLKESQEENGRLDFRIRTELEPRIAAEKRSYDAWVSQDTGSIQCESFSGMVDDLIDFVEDNAQYMDWEDSNGGLEEKILYLIKNRGMDDLLYIAEKEDA